MNALSPSRNGVAATLGGRPLRRVLFFGKNMSRSRCTGALVDALREHDLAVKWVNMATLRRWLGVPGSLDFVRRLHRKFDPDLVFVFYRDLPETLLEELRRATPTVLWVEEALKELDASFIEYLRLGHLVCLSNPKRIPFLRDRGLHNAAFVMSGFSPKHHYPIGARAKRRDVAFIGGPGSHGERAALLGRIAERFRTEVFGPGWEDERQRHPRLRVRAPVKPRGYRRVCATSRIVLGLNQVNDDPLYFSNRTFLSLASGAFHLTRYVPGLEQVFGDGEHLAWYHDAEECLEKIAYYLERDDERERIARNGCALVRAQHRYYHRIGQVFEHLRSGAPAADAAGVAVAAAARGLRTEPISTRPVTEQPLP